MANINYSNALRLLGVRRTCFGLLLMSSLRLRSPRTDLFQSAPVISWMKPLAACVFLHAAIPLPVVDWLVPGGVACCFILMGLSQIAPPTWLFLGASKFASFAAFHNLRDRWRQNGPTLLDRANAEGSAFYTVQMRSKRASQYFFDPAAPRIWSIRTRPEIWEQSVIWLMDYVQLIIVDARGDSEIVRRELEWIAERPARVQKTWYLVSDDKGSAPQGILDQIASKSRMVTEDVLRSPKWFNRTVSARCPP